MNEDERRLGHSLADQALKLNLIGTTTHLQLHAMFAPGTPWQGVEQVFRGMDVLTDLELAVVRRNNDDWAKLRTLPHFRADLILLRVLGQGAMGVVHQALDTNLNRVVAIKIVRMDAMVSGAISRILQRFQREATILAQLDHPAVIKLFEAKLAPDGAPYLLLEYVCGNPLSTVIARALAGEPLELALKPPNSRLSGAEALGLAEGPGALDVRQVAEWGRDLADGLHTVHSHGVIHRDIKPSNILVSEKGKVKLIDFGVAYDSNGHRLTKEGVAVGTALYMAPELLMARRPTPQTDVYALGATLYEALTGLTPFHARDPRILCALIAKGEIPRFRGEGGLRPDVPAELEDIVFKCLAFEADARFPTAQGLFNALGEFLDSSAIRPHTGPCAKGTQAPETPSRPSVLVIAVVGLLVVLLGLALGAVLLTRH